MKLNPDCIRDVLIATEEKTGYHVNFDYPSEASDAPSLSKYEDSEIRYHILQCAKNHLIELGKGESDLSDNMPIKDLTPKGHQFLADIRSDTIWRKTKEVAGKIGSYSLDVLSQIASSVLAELIKSQFP